MMNWMPQPCWTWAGLPAALGLLSSCAILPKETLEVYQLPPSSITIATAADQAAVDPAYFKSGQQPRHRQPARADTEQGQSRERLQERPLERPAPRPAAQPYLKRLSRRWQARPCQRQ